MEAADPTNQDNMDPRAGALSQWMLRGSSDDCDHGSSAWSAAGIDVSTHSSAAAPSFPAELGRARAHHHDGLARGQLLSLPAAVQARNWRLISFGGDATVREAREAAVAVLGQALPMRALGLAELPPATGGILQELAEEGGRGQEGDGRGAAENAGLPFGEREEERAVQVCIAAYIRVST